MNYILSGKQSLDEMTLLCNTCICYRPQTNISIPRKSILPKGNVRILRVNNKCIGRVQTYFARACGETRLWMIIIIMPVETVGRRKRLRDTRAAMRANIISSGTGKVKHIVRKARKSDGQILRERDVRARYCCFWHRRSVIREQVGIRRAGGVGESFCHFLRDKGRASGVPSGYNAHNTNHTRVHKDASVWQWVGVTVLQCSGA